jgi:Sulfotransferase family
MSLRNVIGKTISFRNYFIVSVSVVLWVIISVLIITFALENVEESRRSRRKGKENNLDVSKKSKPLRNPTNLRKTKTEIFFRNREEQLQKWNPPINNHSWNAVASSRRSRIHTTHLRTNMTSLSNHHLPSWYQLIHYNRDNLPEIRYRPHDSTIPIWEPKKIDFQGRARVCVTKIYQTGTCNLYACNRSIQIPDDYGFIVHVSNNTRGHRARLSGRSAAGSGCAISYRYKFLYIHVLKSGGMTIKSLLKRGLCGEPQPCRDLLEIVDCRFAISLNPHFFIFSFVRNPFARMFSAYSMADSMKRNSTAVWSFDSFVNMTNHERMKWSRTSISHNAAQTKFLFDGFNCPVFDFIGRLENFEEDMQFVLNQIQSPELQEYFSEKWKNSTDNCTNFGERKRNSELAGELHNAYRSLQTKSAVVKEFYSDFMLLGYDKEKIP